LRSADYIGPAGGDSFRNLSIDKLIVDRGAYVPLVLRPLVEAAEAGALLVSPLFSIVTSFGFDSFMYGMSVDRQSTKLRIPPDCQMYVFTTPRPLRNFLRAGP